MHGGKIGASSKENPPTPPFEKGGKGGFETEFIIELPSHDGQLTVNESELIHHSNELEAFQKEEAVRIDYGDTANTAEFMKINNDRGRESYLLIVDDEPLFRETIRSLLNMISQVKDHIKVVETDSAENALQLFKAREFDYVIADIDLGKRRMNGYEFVQMILEKHPNTHVLIHSNKRMDELDKNVRQVASDKFMGFLPKPMRASELLQFLACKTFEVSAYKPASKAESKKVLLVNDEDLIRMGLKYSLKKIDGVQILEAAGVSDALSMLNRNNVDIVLTDINLGEGEPDGYELLRKVREQTSQKIKCYVVSGYSKESEGPKALSFGANGYFQLPLEDDQLEEIFKA